jgi:hypothetical protein
MSCCCSTAARSHSRASVAAFSCCHMRAVAAMDLAAAKGRVGCDHTSQVGREREGKAAATVVQEGSREVVSAAAGSEAGRPDPGHPWPAAHVAPATGSALAVAMARGKGEDGEVQQLVGGQDFEVMIGVRLVL